MASWADGRAVYWSGWVPSALEDVPVSDRRPLVGVSQFLSQFWFRAEPLARKPLILNKRRDVRVVEGARLESVCRGNSTVGSNPTLSAIESAKVPLPENPSPRIRQFGRESRTSIPKPDPRESTLRRYPARILDYFSLMARRGPLLVNAPAISVLFVCGDGGLDQGDRFPLPSTGSVVVS